MSTQMHDLDAAQPRLPECCSRVRLRAAGAMGATLATPPLAVVTSGPVTLIGTRRDCDLPLHGHDVSKLHCAIIHDGQRALACDLCSRTGTYVNGRPARVTALHLGDQLRIADFTFLVENDSSAQRTPPPPTPWTSWPITVRVGNRITELSQPAVVIGRRSTCDIVIDTPDASLAHALLFVFQGRPVLFDLGSRSGTFLNRSKVHLAWVGHGDVITVGGEALTVSCPTAPGPADQPSARTPAGVGQAAASTGKLRQEAALTEAAPIPSAAPPALAAAAAGPPAAPPAVSVPAPGVADADQGENARSAAVLHIALRAELERRREELDARYAKIVRHEAELAALKGLVELETEHLTTVSSGLARQSEELQRQSAELEARWQVIRDREQALAAAWSELTAWFERVSAELKLPAGLQPPGSAEAVAVGGSGSPREQVAGAPVNALLQRAEMAQTVWTAPPPNA